LESEVSDFLSSNNASVKSISETVIEPLSTVGEVFIIGGLIRDIAFYGKDERPVSDIDFVVRGNPSKVSKLAQSLEATPNRFGGFGVKTGKFEVDFWCWSKTWAKTQGLVQLRKTKDICATTFFDWDAIVYSTKSGKIEAIDGYLARLHSRTLEINLLENPSKKGSLVRALRRLRMWDAKAGPKLRHFILANIFAFDWNDLQLTEKMAFKQNYLDVFSTAHDAINALVEWNGTHPIKPFVPGRDDRREMFLNMKLDEQWKIDELQIFSVSNPNSIRRPIIKKKRKISDQYSMFDKD